MKAVALQLLAITDMPNDLEQWLKEVFGEPVSRLQQFQSDQMQRLQAKLQELARDAVKDELAKLQHEVAQLHERVTVLENERARSAAEAIEPSF